MKPRDKHILFLLVYFFCIWAGKRGLAQTIAESPAAFSPPQGSSGNSPALPHSLRTKTIFLKPGTDSVVLDSLSIEEGSLHIEGIPDSDFFFDAGQSLLKWQHFPERDSIQVTYRVLPFSFQKLYRHKSQQLVNTNISMGQMTHYWGDTSLNNNFADFKSLDYSGSYSRSLSVGNNQSSSLNSQFNMQLSGYILDSVRVEGAISDNNIPFQPDGNTQRLQQFDQIYLTFQKKQHKLTVGDYNLYSPQGYFINFNKRVQGIMYEGNTINTPYLKNKSGLSFSIAKGQFARNIFQGEEGNQGPYKLTGNNNETYFIVLAGTEKVYIDGVPLVRGADHDYTINYNTAEITFMPGQLITKDKRIQVEFEYQDRSYLNTLFYAYDDLQVGRKLNFHLNIYSNQDAKNQPYTQTLDGDIKRYLSTIGDNTDMAYMPGIKATDSFYSSGIFYRMTDTIVNGILYDSVLVYTTDSTLQLYTSSFANVGAGNGDYIISGDNANGRVYQWTPPVNGLSQGSYAPQELIITPKKQQLVTLATTYAIDSNKKIFLELAGSDYSPNTFSSINNNTHKGFAGHGAYTELRDIGKKDSTGRSPLTLENNVYYEWVQNRFRAIAPYRNIEFNRDWNVDSSTSANEMLSGISSTLKKQHWGSLQYKFDYYGRGTGNNAIRNIVTLDYMRRGWHISGTFNQMNQSDSGSTSRYFRPEFLLERTLSSLGTATAGISYAKEYNSINTADTLSLSSYNYDVSKLYFSNKVDNKTHFELSYMLRRDQIPLGSRFINQSYGQTVSGKLSLNQWKGHSIILTGGFRKLTIQDAAYTTITPSDNVVARLEYNGKSGNGFFSTNLLYEIGTGQEQKMQYSYVEVTAGQGMYMWVDYNGDGIQQVTEFIIAVYPDQKKYIRVLTATNEYIKANYLNINLNLSLIPEALWRRKEHKTVLQQAIGMFSNQFTVQVNNKAQQTAGWKVYNPFQQNFGDTATISGATVLSNTVYFNRSNIHWGADLTSNYVGGNALMTYGLESNGNLNHTLTCRLMPGRHTTFSMATGTGTKKYLSALEDGRTYDIASKSLLPSISVIMAGNLRLTASYQYILRNNTALYGGEKAIFNSAILDCRISTPGTGSLQIKGTFTHISYRQASTDNQAVDYAIMESLSSGNNIIWSVDWNRKVAKGLEIVLDYEGRKTGTAAIIHTGRMSIRAIL